MDPRYHMAHWRRGEAEELKGMYQEAIRDFQDVTALDPPNTAAVAALGHSYALSGQKTEALRLLDNLEKLSRKKQVEAYYRALVYAALGEKDLAFHLLDKAYEQHEAEMMFLGLEPKLDPLRSDSRFAALMHRVGLEGSKPTRLLRTSANHGGAARIH
jgi:tetratricopeptide (TPR) repeat protein